MIINNYHIFMINQYKLLLYIILFMRTIFAISSSNWLFLWMAIELNILSFIPIINTTFQFQETEACVKYFLNQAFGSRIILISRIILWTINRSIKRFIILILLIRIRLKIGAAPFHIWYPVVISSLSWMNCLILSTWQKLAPLSFIAFILLNSFTKLLMCVAILSALLGGALGINQTKLRTIIAYSSITHIGWMFGLLIIKQTIVLVYFMLYRLIIIPLFILLNIKNLLNINISNKLVNLPLLIIIPLILLTLSGIPPFTGFIPKWLVISFIVKSNLLLLLLPLIIGSLISTYYYLSIIFNSMILINNIELTTSSYIKYNYINKIIILATISLFIFPFFFLLYALIILYKS